MKATKISLILQQKEIKLSKGNYDEVDLGHGAEIQYRIRKVGLYVVVESAIGLTVMWDGKTTVRIILEPQHSVSHINCLNYDDCYSKSLDLEFWYDVLFLLSVVYLSLHLFLTAL